MPKKLTQEEAKAKDPKNGPFLTGEYKGVMVKTEYKCKCGNIFLVRPDSIWRNLQKSCGCYGRNISSNNMKINHHKMMISRKIAKNGNSLGDKCVGAIQHWDIEKNKGLTCFNINAQSNSPKRWFKCNIGHYYQMSPHNFYIGHRCSYCVNQKVLKGFNDLLFQRPDIAKEWHLTKNDKGPDEYTPGSNKKVWWLCSKYQHEYQAIICRRTTNNNGCPYCSNHRILKGFNDLLSQKIDLAKEWHPTKNNKSPDEYIIYSNKKVWWLCNKCGNEWKTSINHRMRIYSTGCPCCAPKSKLETKLKELSEKYQLRCVFEKTFDNCRNPLTNCLLKFDVYLIDYDLCIELHGEQHFHPYGFSASQFEKAQLRDKLKEEYAIKNHKYLMIPYNKLNNIEEILIRELNLNGK